VPPVTIAFLPWSPRSIAIPSSLADRHDAPRPGKNCPVDYAGSPQTNNGSAQAVIEVLRERRGLFGVFGRTFGRLGAIMEDPQKLRELAAWYREFAEKTGNPSIWESRLRMAEDLEQEADLLERRRQPVAAE
jgi:hypothetical protein